jgi:uncharacterized hydrophobic protein (TIGR00271 family)
MDGWSWVKTLIKPLSLERRTAVIDELAPSASPRFDFFLLVVLSCSIATLGLITDSAAVIIGAMLIAPLMSPLIAIGLASITGNSKLLRNALSALLRGALLAIVLAALMTLINNLLPFFSIQDLPTEVYARTRPSPIDMIIALAGGIAASYAMTQPNISAALPGVAIATALMPPLCTIGIGIALDRWDVAGGATLLFITNAITIAFSAALVFFLLGFSSDLRIRNHRVPRNLILAALLIVILLIPLSYFSIKFFKEASENKLINSVVENEVAKLGNAELVDLTANRAGTQLDMVITIRTSSALHYEQVVGLQKAIVDGIHQSISLKVNQVLAESLDPLIPPTPTYTPTSTYTSTPGPSPTATYTFTPTNTHFPTSTEMPTYTWTPSPTVTPSSTPTPSLGEIVKTALPELKIYQSPGGPVIGTLVPGQEVTILYGTQIYGSLVWVEIQDSDGRIGWIPEIYVKLILPSATSTFTITSTEPTPTLTLTPSFTP